MKRVNHSPLVFRILGLPYESLSPLDIHEPQGSHLFSSKQLQDLKFHTILSRMCANLQAKVQKSKLDPNS
jgi:hypothetical protein